MLILINTTSTTATATELSINHGNKLQSFTFLSLNLFQKKFQFTFNECNEDDFFPFGLCACAWLGLHFLAVAMKSAGRF